MSRTLFALLWLFPISAFSAGFTKSPAELLRLAADARAGLGAKSSSTILEQETVYTYSSGGLLSTYERKLVAIHEEEGVDSWEELSAAYTPWYQTKPIVKARVVSKEGKVFTLDPAALQDAPSVEFDASVYSDRRTLSGPLPAVAAGAVVEWEATTQDTGKFFSQGTVSSHSLSSWTPVLAQSVRWVFPKEMKLAFDGDAASMAAIEKSSDAQGNQVWMLSQNPAPKQKPILPHLHHSVRTSPRIFFSTGTSWQAVSNAYSELVENALRQPDLTALQLQTIPETASRNEKISAILARIHDQVRYVSIAIGEGALRPRTPVETLRVRYGDCKDKATLLIAALRQKGIAAQMVLVDASYGEEINPKLPGLGQFNHAIVRVPGESPLWIDATEEAADLGVLPIGDQDRLALIVDKATTELVRTPVGNADGNWMRYRAELRFAEHGEGKISETVTATGERAILIRTLYGGEESELTKNRLKVYTTATYGSENPQFRSRPERNAYKGKPATFSWEAEKAKTVAAMDGVAAAAISIAGLLEELPFGFRVIPEPNKSTEKTVEEKEFEERERTRTEPFYLGPIGGVERSYIIHKPAGMLLKELPASRQEDWGGAKFAQEAKALPDGSISVVCRLQILKSQLSVKEAELLRTNVVKFLRSPVLTFEFFEESESDLAVGKLEAAIAPLRANVVKTPSSPSAHMRLSRALLKAGLGELARQHAVKAVDLDAKAEAGYANLAQVLSHDVYGRQYHPGFDRAGALAATRKALAISPDSTLLNAILFDLLSRDADGSPFSPLADLEEALKHARTLPASEQARLRTLVTFVQAALGQWDEVLASASEVNGPPNLQVFRYLAQAVKSGPASALLALQRDQQNSQTRAQTLQNVGFMLWTTRNYGPAAEFFGAAARLTPNPAILRLQTISNKAKKRDLSQLDSKQPISPVLALLSPSITSSPTVDEIAKWVAPSMAQLDLPAIADAAHDLLLHEAGVDLNVARQVGLSSPVLADLVTASLATMPTGSPEEGFTFRTGEEIFSTSRVFVTMPIDGQYKLVAADISPISFARVANDHLRKGNLALAQKWLDLMLANCKTEAQQELLLPAKFFWSGVGPTARNAANLRLALATVLAGDPHTGDEHVKILEKTLVTLKVAIERKTLQSAIAAGLYARQRWAELLPVVRRLQMADPVSASTFRLFCETLEKNKLAAEAKVIAEARIVSEKKRFTSTVPVEDPDALRYLARYAGSQGDWVKAAGYALRLAKQQSYAEEEKATAIWYRLRAGLTDDAQLTLATGSSPSLAGNTLASAARQAAMGNLADAAAQLQQALTVDPGLAGDARSEIVRSLIAKGIGETEEAARLQRSASDKAKGNSSIDFVIRSFAGDSVATKALKP